MPDCWNTRLVAHLAGTGVGTMQVIGCHGYLYIGELAGGGGTQIVDVRDPAHPKRVGRLDGYSGSYSPKVQIGDDRLLVNYEARKDDATFVGLGLWNLSHPEQPTPIAKIASSGKGVHRMWFTGGQYAYVSAVPEGFDHRIFATLDISDPVRAREVCRWEPALAEPAGLHYQLHHPIVVDTVAYMGWWDYGILLADISTPEQPRQIGHLGGWAPERGGHTHTALPLPGRNLLVITDEAADVPDEQTRKFIRIVDIQNPAAPAPLAMCPVPEGDFGRNGVRFGPHNVHENRPGSFVSESVIFATYFGAGLRVYDIGDAAHPREIAHFVPDPDERGYVPVNDIFVDEKGLVYLTDRRDGNLYIVELT